MSWIIFSILAALCWSFVVMADKYVVSKWFKEPLAVLIIVGVSGLIVSFGIYFIRGFQPLSSFNVFLAIIGGAMTLLASVFYFKALKIEEVSRIVPLFYLSPLFVLFLAAIFLNETLAPLNYLGVIFLVGGSILISFKRFSKISFGKAFYLMILSAIVVSIRKIIMKYVLDFTDYWTVFAYERIGGSIAAIPIIYLYLSDLRDSVKKYGKKVLAVLSVTEVLNLVALLLFTIAISIGSVTLVSASSSIQPFFVLLFAVILSVFYPSILEEEIGKSVILLKLLAIVLMFIGVFLIT